MDTFKQYLLDTYTSDELNEIAEHGCASVAPVGMIYYTETTALYDRFCADLHETVGEWVDDIGFVPSHITENIGNVVLFKNAIVWAIAEYHANYLTIESANLEALASFLEGA
jgi:hypothetical protein